MNGNEVFAQNLKVLMAQLHISSAQLARALNVDPALISRWRSKGCSGQTATKHALSIGKYIAARQLSAQNNLWLHQALGSANDGEEIAPWQIALWLYPDAELTNEECEDPLFSNLLVINSFRNATTRNAARPEPESVSPQAEYDIKSGMGPIVSTVVDELMQLPDESQINIFLSSEAVASAIDRDMVQVLHKLSKKKRLQLSMLIQSANNSAMLSRIVSAYMPMLVAGNLQLSLVQGTPQTFTSTMNLLMPGKSVIIITEAVQKKSAAVATVIRERGIVLDMEDNLKSTMRFVRPLMCAYDDNYGRNIIEAFFEEYGMPGNLDVIKSGMNPLYMPISQYGRVLEKLGQKGEQYQCRFDEFIRFKSAMDEVMRFSCFREVLSLPKLNEVAETGRCRMPSMYFMDVGTCYLDAEDCVAILDGYIHYLTDMPSFQVILLSDETLFMENSCWHIKNNKHIIIHSWDTDTPIMVYSDQLLLIDEFQRHFDHLWSRINTAGTSKRLAIETLTKIRERCAQHMQTDH